MIWIQSEKSFGTFLVAVVCRGHEKKHPKTLPLFLFEKKIENLEKKRVLRAIIGNYFSKPSICIYSV